MKEIYIKSIERKFKVREYLDYTELDKLNIYGMYVTQVKLSNVPQKEEKESLEEYTKRLEETCSKEELADMMIAATEQMNFLRHIDELLIVEPKLSSCRPVWIEKLKKTEEYQEIIKAVNEDIASMLNQNKPNNSSDITVKKA